MKKIPSFWFSGRPSLRAILLSPISALYHAATWRRAHRPALWRAPVPVICIGNLTMGGAGKTPTALAMAKYFKAQGKQVFFLSRGYGGRLKGPLLVTEKHSADDVGDEPLLLAQSASVCVSRDRVAGAKLCVKNGADVIIMDDGFQNPHLYKDLSVLVMDGGFGHGNEKVFPAGPLREKLENGLKRAKALVLIGPDKTDALYRIHTICPTLKVLRAQIEVCEEPALQGRKVLAFAGIGRPEKFYDTLRQMGAEIVAHKSFPDHYPYRREEIDALKKKAVEQKAVLVTTQKDKVRLDEEMARGVETVKIGLVWQDQNMLEAMLSPLMDER